MAPKRIVSLTTTSYRIAFIEPVIQSILGQTLPADQVRVYLSEEPHLFDEGVARNQIPPFLKGIADTGRVQLLFTENIGPYRKILPCLAEHQTDDCIIVTADDDTVYPDYWLQLLCEAHRQHPNTVIAFRGAEMVFSGGRLLPYQDWNRHERLRNEYLMLNFATGKDGILYSPRFFDEKVFDRTFLKIAPSGDDIWLKFASLVRGVGVLILDPESHLQEITIPGGISLWDTINRSSNDQTVRSVMDHFGFTDQKLSAL